MRILKTDIPVQNDWTDYEMGEIVHVGHQAFGVVTVWWLSAPRPLPSRRLRVFRTGEDVPSLGHRNPHHVGTSVDVGGRLVWHLFEDVLP